MPFHPICQWQNMRRGLAEFYAMKGKFSPTVGTETLKRIFLLPLVGNYLVQGDERGGQKRTRKHSEVGFSFVWNFTSCFGVEKLGNSFGHC